MKKLLSAILACIVVLVCISKVAFAEDRSSAIYFYSPTCGSCMKIEEMLSKYENDFKIVKLDVSKDKNIELFEEFCQKYNIPEKSRSVPAMFSGDQGFVGEDAISKSLRNGTIKESTKKALLLPVNSNDNKNYEKKSISIIYLLSAGLLDGINPCAVAMLLLLMSLLGFAKDKMKILKISICFIAGIFVSYYFLGIFLFSIVSNLNFTVLNKIIKVLIVVLCIVLGTLNLRDAIYVKDGNYGKILLQLPKGIKKLNKKIMSLVVNMGKNKSYLLYILIFILGIAISFTEFLCTGQIYLPVILSITQVHRTIDIVSCIYFMIYNIAFITPLIIICALAIKSNSVMLVSSHFSEKIHIIKFLNAIFFLIVGIVFFIINFIYV